MKYTAQETRDIEAAYHALCRMTERSHSAERKIREGYNYERRIRSNSTVVKALQIRAAKGRWRANAGTLFSMSHGLAQTAMAAAEGRRLADSKEWKAFLRLATTCSQAHRAAFIRQLEENR